MVTAVWKASFLICQVWGVGPYFLTDIVQQFIGLVKSPGEKLRQPFWQSELPRKYRLCVHSAHEFLQSFILVTEWLRVVDRFHSAIGQLEWIMNLPVIKHKLFITTPSLYFWYSFKEHLSVFSMGYEINCILRSGVRCNCINMIYLLNSCT